MARKVPLRRHPYYPQSSYMFRRSRLHAPTANAMGFGADLSPYTHGSYDPATPYPFQPKHTGLDGFAGDMLPGCDTEGFVNWLAEQLLKVSPFNKLPSDISFMGISILKPLKSALFKLGATALNGIIASALKGAPALRSYLAEQILPRLAKDINAAIEATGIPEKFKISFGVSGAQLSAAFDMLMSQIVKWAEGCRGQTASGAFDPKAIFGGPQACNANGYQAAVLTPNDPGYVQGVTQYRCVTEAPATGPESFVASTIGLKSQTEIDMEKAIAAARAANLKSMHLMFPGYKKPEFTEAVANDQVYRQDAPKLPQATGGAGAAVVLGGAALAALLLLR